MAQRAARHIMRQVKPWQTPASHLSNLTRLDRTAFYHRHARTLHVGGHEHESTTHLQSLRPAPCLFNARRCRRLGIFLKLSASRIQRVHVLGPGAAKRVDVLGDRGVSVASTTPRECQLVLQKLHRHVVDVPH